MTVDIDPRFRDDFERLFAELDLLDLDALMTYDGYFTEPPMYTLDSQLSFLDGLPLAKRNRILIRASVWHLGRILDHARGYYAGREFDYFCAVTVTGWEFLPEGDMLVPRFWLANPSRGVFNHMRLAPPASDGSALVADCLDHDPGYVLNDDVVRDPLGERLERVFVQRTDCTVPRANIEPARSC